MSYTQRHASYKKKKTIFTIEWIKEPYTLIHTGRAARLVDSPSEHIITDNPQAFRNTGNKDRDEKIAKMINQSWIPVMKRMNPNPFKEHPKKNLLRGEAWIHPVHNPSWVTGKREKRGLPVLFLIPDPMIIYASPNEDENGIPEQAIVYYMRHPGAVKSAYPNWTNPETKGGGKEPSVVWMEYWRSAVRYFEADGEPILVDHKGRPANGDGIQENIYGFNPWIHKYSGFGTSSFEGKPEDLIVGRLRKVKDKLREECGMTTDIANIIHLFANPRLDIYTAGQELPPDFANEYDMGAGALNIVPLPPDSIKEGVQSLPRPEVFAHLANIRAEIEREDPLVMAGYPIGGSGRQQDMTYVNALRRYDTVVENTEVAFSTAFGMALQMIEKVPGLKPDELRADDIRGNYDVRVMLKASDPAEADRLATLGSRLFAQREIDLMTNLTQYKGYTQDKAQEVIVQMLADAVTINNPYVAQYLGMVAAKEMGMEDAIEWMKQQAQAQGGIVEPPSPTEQRRRAGEVETPQGEEMIDESLRNRGARRPPQAYFRESPL